MGRHVRILAITAACLAASPPAQIRCGGFPEGQAAIEQLLLHFDAAVAGRAFPVARDLLKALPSDVTVVIAVESQKQVSAARFWLGETLGRRKTRFVVSGATLTPWARDRVVALSSGSVSFLVSPSAEYVDPDRWGDVLAAKAAAVGGHNTWHACIPLAFEGGNLLFTTNRVLFTRDLVVANSLEPNRDEGALLASVREAFGRDPLPLGDPARLPHAHLDMFATIVDDHTVLLADPRIAEGFLVELARHGLDGTALPLHDRWSVQSQREARRGYEVVERELRAAGFRIQRMPILHGTEGVLSWNNALLERRGSQKHAYVPVYGVPYLDNMALKAWARAGFVAFPIDVSRMAELGGRFVA